jgi:hypothetical protein
MRKFMAGIAGSVTVACLLSGAGPALGGLQNPPLGWTFTFAQARSIGGNTAVTSESGLANAPVRTPRGYTVGHFVRIEIQDGDTPMGIVTLNEAYRTVAIPLDRLRFNPAGREVLTDMSWLDANTAVPSGRRAKGSRWYAYGRPAG